VDNRDTIVGKEELNVAGGKFRLVYEGGANGHLRSSPSGYDQNIKAEHKWKRRKLLAKRSHAISLMGIKAHSKVEEKSP
jgi:hypothetical protein